MAALTDSSIGIGVESVYGTSVTPTRWYEFLSESFDYDKTVVQGKGMRVGAKVARSGRRVITKYSAGGKIELEVPTKGMGLLWQAALGTGVSNLISGSAYQQQFTLGATVPSSLTVQKGVIAADAAGTVQPYTFKGAVCAGWELKASAGDVVTASFDFDARDMATATAYTAPTYPAAPVNLYHFAQGAITIGGTVTAPTTTTLATGGTSVANVRDFSLQGDNGVSGDRYTFGNAGLKSQPAWGERKIKGKMTVEVTDTTLRDAVIADTPLAVVLTFTSTETLSSGVAQMQVVLSEVKFSGNMPTAKTDVATMSLDFDVLDNLTAAQPIYIIHRTADTAL